MSLPQFNCQKSLFDVDYLLGSLLGNGPEASWAADQAKPFVFFAEQVWPKLAELRPKLETMYCPDNGRPAEEPVRMLGVLILQFMERVPDRQAAVACQFEARWKLALHLAMNEQSFHPSGLVKFRNRLLEHGLEGLGFEGILELLMENGYVPKHAKQRLDSTHILGLVSRMSRLDCVRETIRLALQELAFATGETAGGRPETWVAWWERYVDSQVDYKSPVEVLKEKMIQAGRDTQAILAWVANLPAEVSQGEKVQLLARVFAENFEVITAGEVQATRSQPAGSVCNPHDPEAQWSSKSTLREKEWVGYKTQVAETVQDEPREKGEPTKNFVTSMVTQMAPQSEKAGMEQTLQEQKAMGLEPPPTLYVDTGYVSGAAIDQAADEGRRLLGPALPSRSPGGRFSAEQFQVNVEERRAVCPAGQESRQCSRLENKETGKVDYRFEWSTACHDCPLRDRCVSEDQRHRTLVVGEHHTALQARREEMKTDSFKQEMKRRSGIEGTHSELVRGHGLRRARYRGYKKVRLQNYLIGAACNIKRWFRRVAWEARQAAAAAVSVATPSAAAEPAFAPVPSG